MTMVRAPEQPARTGITLTADEIRELTRYDRPAFQLRELQQRGFSRAYIRAGAVVLERAHYEAVCRGTEEQRRGRVKPPVRAPRAEGGR